MKLDLLVAEIGSTTTVVNAFNGMDKSPVFLGQGFAPTSVLEGDVRVGLAGAVDDLAKNLGESEVTYAEMLATSSAAGGLRMTVHGLVYDMTVKAAKEAALGAGANLHLTTAGKLRDSELEQIKAINPNVILLAGGTDYGERDTALFNAERIAGLGLGAPVIYAGNVQNQPEVESIMARAGIDCRIVENVYPRLDELNIEPTRRVIHDVFERHIIHAPGMEHVREMVTGNIMPTPGAVMQAATQLYELIGDLVVLDVGGATTDVHSVTEGSDEIASIQIYPEPRAKRTVEGDLGVYINAKKLAESVGIPELERELELDIEEIFQDYRPIPETPAQLKLTESLAYHAAATALERHCGRLRHLYGASGRQMYAEGKDLTIVKTLVATGGALTRLPGRAKILDSLNSLNTAGNLLLPKPGAMKIMEDSRYIFASLGVMSLRYPQAAAKLLELDISR